MAKRKTIYKSSLGSGETSGMAIKPPDVPDARYEGRRETQMTLRILVWATKWVVGLFTEMKGTWECIALEERILWFYFSYVKAELIVRHQSLVFEFRKSWLGLFQSESKRNILISIISPEINSIWAIEGGIWGQKFISLD